jgi:hypothetical protein
MTLLHLRDLAEKQGTRSSIVSEMLDPRNRELAEVARADDFIIGDKLVSQLLAQLSENPELVLDDLFDASGAEIYLRPANHYVREGVPVSFYTVLESAKRRGEVAIGYRLIAEQATDKQAHGAHLNPLKTNKITFSAGDKIIVLAQG